MKLELREKNWKQNLNWNWNWWREGNRKGWGRWGEGWEKRKEEEEACVRQSGGQINKQTWDNAHLSNSRSWKQNNKASRSSTEEKRREEHKINTYTYTTYIHVCVRKSWNKTKCKIEMPTGLRDNHQGRRGGSSSSQWIRYKVKVLKR